MEIESSILIGMEVKDVISLGALSVAFLALFIAPIVNSRISKRQVIAPMRQAWINALRDKISEFISIVSINREHTCPTESDSSEQKNIAFKEDKLRYERLILLVASIELHINSSEKDHTDLVGMLESITTDYHESLYFPDKLEKLVKLSQKILSDEWKATKRT